MRGNRGSGFALGLLAGVSFGAATVFARQLASAGLSGATVLTVRFAVAAAVLAVVMAMRGQSLRPAPGERVAAVGLGVFGYGAVAALFFAALQRGSAGGVTVLFYVFPAVVAVIEVMSRRVAAEWRIAAGVSVAIAGTVTIVHGAGLTMSRTGVLFALGAACAFAVYLAIAERSLVHTPPPVCAFWSSAGVAIVGVARIATGARFSIGAADVVPAIASGVATACAFAFLFLSLTRLGPTRTAVVLNVEAVAAVAFGALTLGEHVGTSEAVGGALVIAAAIWTTWNVVPTATPSVHAESLLAPVGEHSSTSGRRQP